MSGIDLPYDIGMNTKCLKMENACVMFGITLLSAGVLKVSLAYL